MGWNPTEPGTLDDSTLGITDVSPKPAESEPEYLGDGLFAQFDGWQFEVYSSNGIQKTNVVFMEPSTLTAFFAYVERIRRERL